MGDGLKPPAPISPIIFLYRHDRIHGGDVVTGVKGIPEVTIREVMSGEFDLMGLKRPTPRVHTVWKLIAAMPSVENTVLHFC